MSSRDIHFSFRYLAAVTCLLFAGYCFSQVHAGGINNPGVQQSGAVTSGHGVTWGPGTGQIQDGGAAFGNPGGTSGQIQWNNAGAFGGFTASQDCTVNTSTGVFTCTKTNNVAFAPSATTDTTNAANIGSGNLSLSRLALASGLIYVGNAGGNPAGVAMSQDCTITNAGVITCTKTNNVAFAPSATTDTTNAGNILSGSLGSARLPAPFTNGTRQGNTSAFVTYNGAAPTSGHVATYDVNGNIQDGGAAGSGTVTSVTCFGSAITTSGTCTTAAAKSDQQTGSSTTLVVTPSQQQSHDSAVKAWAVWTAGAVALSYNVTSITNSATGVYDVVFTTAFSGANNYGCSVTSTPGIIAGSVTGSKTASNFRVDQRNASGINSNNDFYIVCYGRQ